jgi:hypothetical protein
LQHSFMPWTRLRDFLQRLIAHGQFSRALHLHMAKQ